MGIMNTVNKGVNSLFGNDGADYIMPASYNYRTDLLWIKIEAYEFESQRGYSRGAGSIKTGNLLSSWKLLAPKEILDSISHDWNEYESIGTRVAQKIGTFTKAKTELKGVYKTAETAISNGVSEGNVIKNAMGNLVKNNEIPKYKIDSAVVYQETKRRSFSFLFNFAITPWNANTETEIFEPVRKLQELSCATHDGDLINLQFPAIFKIYSTPGNLIKMNQTALTIVQPTWIGPFYDGYPSRCELQLTFDELTPLYRRNFSSGGTSINIKSSEKRI